MKINSNFRLFAATHFDASKYISSPAYGVERFMLDRIGNEKARATTIVEYKPNSKFPKHTHIGGEEFIVLRGTFKDQYGEFPAGTYVRNPIGSAHEPWVDEDGCTIMVKLLQMAETGEGTKPLHVHHDEAKAGAETVDYGAIADLYENDTTGEVVQMCWIDPDKEFPPDSKSEGGEELFILSGSLHVPSLTSTFEEWGWLRFPSKTTRETLKAGPDGAHIYRKTGHLTEKSLALEKIRIGEDEKLISQ